MSDTFEYSAHEENQGGNTPQGSEPVRENASPKAVPYAACSSTSNPSRGERRSRRRAMISAPVRVRSLDVTDGDLAVVRC